MEYNSADERFLKKKSNRYGLLSIVFLFLSALLWSVDFSFLLIFGTVGIYCAYLWIHFANLNNPKKETSYQSTTQSRPTSNQALPTRRIVFFVIGSAILFISAMMVVLLSNVSDSEIDNDDDYEQTSEENTSSDEDFRIVLQRNPNDAEALTNAGNSFFDNENYDSALYYYNRVLTLNENDASALYNKALVLFNQKDFSGAAGLASRCIQIDPSNTDALLLLGDCYESQDNLDVALTQYNKAYELGTRTPGLSNMLGYIHDTKGNIDKAIFFYKEALRQDSSKIDIYTRLAELEPANKKLYDEKAKEWKTK